MMMMMQATEIAQSARRFSVMVRVQGPDPKCLKMRNHAFHLHQSGNTSLSASGLLLPPGSLREPPQILEHISSIHHHTGTLVVTVASVIEPFLTAQHRDNPTKEFSPKLIPGACIDVLIEGRKEGNNHSDANTIPYWVSSQLLALVDLPPSSDALMSLFGAQGGRYQQASWEVGWSLPPLGDDSSTGGRGSHRQVGSELRFSGMPFRSLSSDDANNPTVMANSATRIAILGVSPVDIKDDLNISKEQKRGDFLLVVGSPFGVLSPLHFYNSISVGTVANICPASSDHNSLLMADIHGLPGMEGAPVFDKHGSLTGILTRPLKQRGATAEIQLVISWDAIATAQSNGLKNEAQRVCGELIAVTPSDSHSSLEKAISSIALVTVGDGSWASGIVLNSHGLILTNAHVLEPSRFERRSLVHMKEKTTPVSLKLENFVSQQKENPQEGKSFILSPSRLESADDSSLSNSNYRSYRRISVRLYHMGKPILFAARVVYISKGPWDVALLQIESVPDKICPITPEFVCPAVGSTVHVIGHGLLGPRSGMSPSISSGVLANVIHLHESRAVDNDERKTPVMLQTTAAIHPGASGGAVVNSDGRLIGLVTSNARHGGGTIIPHLNFSIPATALEPFFKFSDKHDLSILEALDNPNELLSSVWALTPPTPLQSPSEKNGNEAKGSRFSQFLAEKQTEFTPFKNQKQQSIGRFPSKL